MKLKFKLQAFQTAAVEAVLDCFAGQTRQADVHYRIDQGTQAAPSLFESIVQGTMNAEVQLSDDQVLENVRRVQRGQQLPLSAVLTRSAECKYNLDVEMETGTGKTYCYIKTMFEMHRRFGWSKFIVMVPSIAIREGVSKSFQITSDHFMESYGRQARYFTYNSNRLHELESYSSDAGVQVMVINIQAFNARGAANRRIYDELDDFQSRRPIDVISANRPILIQDEPQKMGGKATMSALPKFNPLMILRYSATHRVHHDKVFRLDAVDAYSQKLVKKIAVRGIATCGLPGTHAYLYLEGIEISTRAPVARIEMEVRLASSGKIKRRLLRLGLGQNLFAVSGEMDQYRGFTISQIDYNQDLVQFKNGHALRAGEAAGDVSEPHMRRIQIREAIRAHLDKECRLFSLGIKVLTLFFVDTVAKYRNYTRKDTKGDYARIFEEEYATLRKEFLSEIPVGSAVYQQFLRRDPVEDVHAGYFSIDKTRLVDPAIKKRGVREGHSDDQTAYSLILKNKEQLLSQHEPVRFIFSHSALREGWDNPNVFVMCMLKRSNNTISRRQEVGRGLRLSVNQQGDRMDNPATVHDINVLTVVAGESYRDFTVNLQKEISATLSARPRKADAAYFEGKILRTAEGDLKITPLMARQIYRYLVKQDYTDDSDQITDAYHQAREKGELAPLPKDLRHIADQVFSLIDGVYSESLLPKIGDDRRPKNNPLNDNFEKQAFRGLWDRINRKAIYQVDFDSDELVKKSVRALNRELHVTPLQYTIQKAIQDDDITEAQLRSGYGFTKTDTQIQSGGPVHSRVKYDLVGKIAANTSLTRKTAAMTLGSIAKAVFDKFNQNPEQFITKASRIINEQKATTIIERLEYDSVEDRYGVDIFTAGQHGQDFARATGKLRKHIYDYAVTDSDVERDFVNELDTSAEVVVYANLPRGFRIPTPVGDYNPDWALSFQEGAVKSVYFVAETKGSMSSMQLRMIENIKIKCARRFFDELNHSIEAKTVKFDVVTNFAELIDLVR